MFKFGKTSLERLATCEPELQQVMHELIKLMDVSILEGHRPKEKQDEAFSGGFSKTPWPKSKHNSQPSCAVDVTPYPVRWPSSKVLRDTDAQSFARFAYMIGLARGIASQRGIKLRSGLDWDSDGEVSDTSFFDLPHLEITDGSS